MLKQFFIVFGALAGALLLFLYLFQRHLIYFPSHMVSKRQDYQAMDMHIVSLHTRDNLELTAWYKPAKAHQHTVVFLHGNAGHIGTRMKLLRPLINAGFGALLLEYRGYGGNIGHPTEAGLYEDGRSAVRFLYQQHLKPSQVFLYGESLGTGVATQLAVEYHFCAVILQSPFTSLVSLARIHYPYIIFKPWDKFNSLERIKKVHSPLLILHGTHDPVVPYSEGLALFNQANEPKEMITFAEKHHNDLWDSPEFSEKIINFVNKECQP